MVTWLHRIGLYAVLPSILALNCYSGFVNIKTDITSELSKSRAFGAVLAADPALTDAIVVAEPDEFIEAISYYLPNRTYLLREKRFGPFVTWSDSEQLTLTLGEVLAAMTDLRRSTGRPVVLALGHPIEDRDPANVEIGWGRNFTFTAEEARALRAATRKLDLGAPALNENFEAYLLE
jgi:hypothetical protein